MTFQPGNKLGTGRKEKPFRDALIMALKEAGDDRPRLRVIASKLIARAEEGDMQAIKEFADRIDGKVPQAIEGGDTPIEIRAWRWLMPTESESSHTAQDPNSSHSTNGKSDGQSLSPTDEPEKPSPVSTSS